MTLRVVSGFERRWTVFWATTYTFELPFFESFLLPRLGEPPLNATIMLDANRHGDALQDLAMDTPWRGARANRDYLIRGVAPTSGAFHPKTYLFANQRTGLLFVGSGNLTMSGLETGKELFGRFDAADATDLGAIRGWRAWMDDVVAAVDDRAVRDRWRDAQVRAPWLVGPVHPGAFVTNWQRPLLDAFLAGITAPVDELHLTAPFYDQHVAAVREIVARTRPRRIDVLLGRDASVHGRALLDVLVASGARVELHGLDPDTYVHGKLLGVVWGGRGRVLSGSANLSIAALLRAAAVDPGANVECGAIADVDPEIVRSAFEPPPPPAGLAVVARDAEAIGSLCFAPAEESRFEVHLRSATWLDDGRIRLDVSVPLSGRARLSNGEDASDLDAATTVEPFPDATARLVWVTDVGGAQVSNKVAIDEPARLRAILEERNDDAGRPAGIEAADLETPVGQMLARLHAACIFDFDETPTARRIARAADSESEDPDFWDRLAREDLRQDPRVARYLQLGGGDTPLLDGVFLDIARMLEVVPGLVSLHPVGDTTSSGAERGTGTAWTPDRKLQVRLFNLLERWCAALSDPRLQWISPLTPVANFAALVGAVRECWSLGYLPERRMVTLVGVLLTAFLRSERRPGFMARLGDEDRSAAIATLAASATPAVFTATVFAAVRPSQKDLLTYLFAWQPALADGLASAVLRADEKSSALVHELTGYTANPEEIIQRITWASTYLDDAHWSETISREMSLPVTLTTRKFASRFGATVSVGSGVDLLGDARVVEIVRRAIAYRKTDGCIVESGANRLSIQLFDTFGARLAAGTINSDDIVTAARLEAMAAAGAPFSELIWNEEVAS